MEQRWSTEYLLGIPALDIGHEALFAGIQQLCSPGVDLPTGLQKLREEAARHFEREEQLLRKRDVNDSGEEKRARQCFFRQLWSDAFIHSLGTARSIADYLRATLVMHIADDARLFGRRVSDGESGFTRALLLEDAVGQLWEGLAHAWCDLERRHREFAESAERYRLLVERTSAVPFELDPSTLHYTYVSPQVLRLLGLSNNTPGIQEAEASREAAALVDALRSASFLDLVHADDKADVERRVRSFCAARTPGSEIELEYRVVGVDGRESYVRTTLGFDAASATVARGVSLNVTQQKQVEAELRQAQKLESVGRLAAGVAHEINTPVQYVSDSLSFIRDGVQGLKQVIEAYRAALEPLRATVDLRHLDQALEEADYAFLVEELPRAVDRSLDGIGRVASIVRSLKDFAHPDQKERSYVDINRGIESTLTIARNEYKYVADIELALDPNLPGVPCHAGDINQCVLNLVVNAAHAIEDVVKGTGSRGLIRVATRATGDGVELAVSDTGGGIPENIRHRIFDPFFTTKEVGRGTGQGLAIVRSTIEKHQGRVSFDTGPTGTTFTLWLPLNLPSSPGSA
ncbi:MAG: ATP-binding protein [Myxococcota bacterium]